VRPRLVVAAAWIALALAARVAGAMRGQEPTAGAPDRDPPTTFSRDIAPILFRSCAPCHRPGGAGPFPLLSYADARGRARQIREVTGRRFMPPWLPDRGAVPFRGDRRLSADEIERIRRWVTDGSVEGDPADLPAVPTFPAGWTLGTPDRIVDLPAPYELAAEGLDVYRNFVVPLRVSGERWVEAIELTTTAPRVLHHARAFVDRTPGARIADAQDPEPGFGGMVPASAESPDGILLGWTPGKVAARDTEGLAWRVDERTDLVVQLHMVPSGRPERVQVSLGLYFAAAPPQRRSFTLLLGNRDIDLAPGVAGIAVRDRYTLPVDVDVVGLYPHAHYLAREMTVAAERPEGTRTVLLHIPEWDFTWQDEYRFATPVGLSAGTVVSMEYVYDNSAENPRNPHVPPRAVAYGGRTTDEMAELAIQVALPDRAAAEILEAHHARWSAEQAVAYRKKRIAHDPDDFESHAAAGSGCLVLGRVDEAVDHLRAAARLHPADAEVRNNLGFALLAAGRVEDAIAQFEEALALSPDLAQAHRNLAQALTLAGRFDEAVAHHEREVALQPDSAEAHAAFGRALHAARRNAEAIAQLEDAARLAPEEPAYLRDLAWVLATGPGGGDMATTRAVALAERAVAATGRREIATLRVLAVAYARAGRFGDAATATRDALLLTPDGPEADALRREAERYEAERARHESGE